MAGRVSRLALWWRHFPNRSALLVSDALLSDEPEENFDWHWDLFADLSRAMETPVRTAPMNAFWYGARIHKISDSVVPGLADRLTSTPSDFRDHLVKIAKSMTQEEHLSVARADNCRFDEDAEKHLAELNKMLAGPNCRFSGEAWFPLELVAWSPGRGFLPCTALLLIDALDDGVFHANDQQGWLSTAWGLNCRAYCQLPAEDRIAILKAFRFLYETDDEFHLSHWAGMAKKRVEREVTPIPWTRPETRKEL